MKEGTAAGPWEEEERVIWGKVIVEVAPLELLALYCRERRTARWIKTGCSWRACRVAVALGWRVEGEGEEEELATWSRSSLGSRASHQRELSFPLLLLPLVIRYTDCDYDLETTWELQRP